MSKLYELLKDGETDGEKLASEAAKTVNSFSPQYGVLNEILADSETEQKFQQMSVAYTKQLAIKWKDRLYDGRNEAACKIASILVGYEGFESIKNITAWNGTVPQEGSHPICSYRHLLMWGEKNKLDIGGKFAYCMTREHRTLQQSFAGLTFTCIERMLKSNGYTDVNKYMEENGVYEWTILPMI